MVQTNRKLKLIRRFAEVKTSPTDDQIQHAAEQLCVRMAAVSASAFILFPNLDEIHFVILFLFVASHQKHKNSRIKKKIEEIIDRKFKREQRNVIFSVAIDKL